MALTQAKRKRRPGLTTTKQFPLPGFPLRHLSLYFCSRTACLRANTLRYTATNFHYSECWEEYQGSKPPTEKCSQCGEPLSGVGGKFSGNYMKLEGDVKVHGTCCGLS